MKKIKAVDKKIILTHQQIEHKIRRIAYQIYETFIDDTDIVIAGISSGGYIFANYMKDAISQVVQYDYEGRAIREVKLPGVGSAGGFGGKKTEKELYFSFSNYVTPGTIYSFDPKTGTSKEYQKPKVDFNSADYESKQVFYTSKDGTKIPMIITHKKGIKLDGKNPTILYGYGGFNVSLTPSFSITNAVWMENGGIYAVANLRGGGEYGKKWHDAGTQMKKQNVFDDFIAAGEYLIAQKYTSSDYLAIRGGSNGGLLVGAVMTQRPDLAIKELRGNVPTRIDKLRQGQYDAILLARAGVLRLELDLSDLETIVLDPTSFIPAPAQGVLGLQTRVDDAVTTEILQKLHHSDVATRIGLERSVLRQMDGGCQLPLGVYCVNDQVYVSFSPSSAEAAENKVYSYVAGQETALAQEIVQELKK